MIPISARSVALYQLSVLSNCFLVLIAAILNASPRIDSVPILQAMSIVEKVVENEVLARVIRKSRDSLELGRSMTEPMQSHWAFQPLVTQMIAIGEETGALDAMLSKIAEFYEKEV